MSYKCLAEFLEELAAAGELVRVAAEVDCQLEIAEITRRVAAAGGPALLFDRVRGQSIAVVANLLGTEARAARALAVDSLDAIAERLESLIAEHTPQNWFDRLRMSADNGAAKFAPRTIKSGPSQQVVHLGRDVNLATFPLVKSYPAESGAAIAAGMLVTEDRQTHIRSLSNAPLVAVDNERLAVVDDGHSIFARHWADHQAAGQRMPAAVVLGGDPAGAIAAHLELPAAVDGYLACGLLRAQALHLVKCRTHVLEVPAEADLVIEGYLDPQAEPVSVQIAGACGNYYRAPRPAPVFHVTAVTHRSRPIFPALVATGGAGEPRVLARARERLLLPALRKVAPDVVDLHLPALGGLHRYAFVAFRKRYDFQARQVAAALWAGDALRFTRFLVLVDHDVNVHDVERVLEHLGANVAPDRDLFAFDGPPHGSDHAGSLGPLARRLAFDATAKLPGECSAAWPPRLDPGDEVHRLVTARWAEYRLELAAECGPIAAARAV